MKTLASYDAIPYPSAPIRETHPRHLAAMALLHGLAPPNPETARILEIGCGHGGNLLPMAISMPEATFMGVELSEVQARTGQERIQMLGLGNIRILHGDILDFPEDSGPFDYIVAHGLYSWVPQPVREKILALCGQTLSPHGLAFISHNTLPGWRLRGMMRDYLRFKSSAGQDDRQRLALAQTALVILEQSLDKMTALHATYLTKECQHLKNSEPGYLFHEFLSEVNDPLLFTDFLQQAAPHGLGYLCDADPGVNAPQIHLSDSAMLQLEGDPLHREQMADFLIGRQFRSNLLCRGERNPHWNGAAMAGMALVADLQPPQPLDLTRTRGQTFFAPGGGRFQVHHPLTRAALILLTKNHPEAIPFSTLAAEASSLLLRSGGGHLANQTDELLGELTSLWLLGAIHWLPTPRTFPTPNLEYPTLTPLARLQAQAGEPLSTHWHEIMQPDPLARHLLLLLDGSHTPDSAAALLVEEILAGRLQSPATVRERPNQKEGFHKKIIAHCQNLLHLFARGGLLRAR